MTSGLGKQAAFSCNLERVSLLDMFLDIPQFMKHKTETTNTVEQRVKIGQNHFSAIFSQRSMNRK